MHIDGWKYYNHSAIPQISPSEMPDLHPIESGDIWKIDGGVPLLARWTTDFDCGYETNWWHVIKDTPFDLYALKAKHRYEIKKGIKNFEIRVINPCEWKEELYQVQIAAFAAYPKKNRPSVEKNKFLNAISDWRKYTVFGAFFKETNELVGYALLSKPEGSFIGLNVLKFNPDFERYAGNAALVCGILNHYVDFLQNGGFICDGSRSINHETHFQDYLEKYFGFRKAYCHLHIQYNPKIKWLIKLLFPLRKVLAVFDGIGIFHSILSVLKMEEIYRENLLEK